MQEFVHCTMTDMASNTIIGTLLDLAHYLLQCVGHSKCIPISLCITEGGGGY